MNNRIVQTEYNFQIFFKFHPIILQAIKELPNRRFVDGDIPHWVVPLSAASELNQFAKKFKFDFIAAGSQAPGMSFDFSDHSYPDMPELEGEVELKRPLFPFQRNGVAYILKQKRVIVGDQMGLGKTAQSIAAIHKAGSFPCLVICPATLRENWKREWEMWTDRKVLVLDPKNQNRWPTYCKMGIADVIITNYESLKKYFVDTITKSHGWTLKDVKFNPSINEFKSIIIDEAHRCKTTKTHQAKFCKGISDGKEYVLAITGTPVVNKPDDLISQLGIINQLDKFGGYRRFKDMYCDRDLPGARMHLNAMLRRHCFYRREKHEVLKDLPAKTRQVVFCDISTRKEYVEAENSLSMYLRKWRNATDAEVEKSMRGEIMVQMGVLKNVSARGKMESVYEFIDDVMESGEKLIVFAHLKDIIKLMKTRYPNAVTITGDDNAEERQRSVDQFQKNPEVKLILCSIQAAGVGITLTSSSRVAFVELAWHPAIHNQAEDRAHRIGQTDNVQCTYFLGRGTIDEMIYDRIESKRTMSNEVTGAVDPTSVSVMDDVIQLLSKNASNGPDNSGAIEPISDGDAQSTSSVFQNSQ